MWRSWHPKTKRKQLVPGEATFLMIVLWEATSYLKRKKARKEERERGEEGGREKERKREREEVERGG